MDIIEASKQEESKLQQQLTAVQGAIAALNGSEKTAVSPGHKSSVIQLSVDRGPGAGFPLRIFHAISLTLRPTTGAANIK